MDGRPVSLEALEQSAGRLARMLRTGDAITLRGEVGAGKTTFARSLIGALAPGATEITSPTFTLMQSYDVTLGDGAKEVLWHLDLYRLKSVEEAHSLGLREIWPHVSIIEWPEVIEAYLPENRLDIILGFAPDADMRTMRFNANDAWRKRLTAIG